MNNEPDANRDPISGETGAHPVGTGIGAAGAGAVGAAIGGAIGGPVGAAIGIAVGAFAGGLAGKSVAETIDPTEEDAYWRDNYTSEPYVEPGVGYDDYAPAYRTGYDAFPRYYGTGKNYDEIEPELQREYETNRGNSNLTWEKAKHATRAAWDKVERTIPGDIDKDGK
ncbi:MAG TPA: hypothetical protein DDW76_12125 [Cyanobacteria bacterium UBA11369]|nr:hypothetical protein [Cyanobacteria bacterium UBA11371]HBE33601.1 hypothetical protein [Cyanobacteria bacterium UBA11368]HBE49518.1 hypothetical protein [Cyanobacteria bacterium UBA11369]